jgi:hypothetical protein
MAGCEIEDLGYDECNREGVVEAIMGDTEVLREPITAAICKALGHTHPGIDPTVGIPAERCNDGLLADAVLRVLAEQHVFHGHL